MLWDLEKGVALGGSFPVYCLQRGRERTVLCTERELEKQVSYVLKGAMKPAWTTY